MNDVAVHYNSARPSQLGAHAYTQGTEIHLAPGQDKHLPHEAWHVAQQKQGRVEPTWSPQDGVAVNTDPKLEREATAMGARAARKAEEGPAPQEHRNAPIAHPVTQMQLANGEYATKQKDTNLRSNGIGYPVIKKLYKGEEVAVISKGMKVSKFKAGWVSNEHSWVRTEDGLEGWIEDSKLIFVRSTAEILDLGSGSSSEDELIYEERVELLFPDFELPTKPTGLRALDPEEVYRWESDCAKAKTLINAQRALQDYANEHKNDNEPKGKFKVKSREGGVTSEYHRGGEKTRRDVYKLAEEKGYDLSDDYLLILLDTVVAAYHSYYYESMMTSRQTTLW